MEPSLLQRYRRDRRKLLEFLLSSGLIREIRTPAGSATAISGINLDVLSTDYVLQCVKSGGVLDISEATKKFSNESMLPMMRQSRVVDSFFLLSEPESSGSPPRRAPPSVEMNHVNNHASHQSVLQNHLLDRNVAVSWGESTVKYEAPNTLEKLGVPSLGLPALDTGLSDDHLRESAYEIFLACMAYFGLEIHYFEEQKQDRSSGFLGGFKNKRDKRHLQPQSPAKHSVLIDTIRVQMQISEAMDICIRQRLMQFASRKACGQIDVPQISLGLLEGIYKSDFPNEKSCMQWMKRQVNVLEELIRSADHLIPEQQMVGTLLAKTKHVKERDTIMSPSDRAEVLSAIRHVASILSSVPGHYGIQGETCFWTTGYHLNIRLYEKLLFGIFDILEEGQLIEEADDILKLLKLTWSTLGITQKIHDALYGWVLFQQFILTQEAVLLDLGILEVEKALSSVNAEGKEEQYMNALRCSAVCNGSEVKLSLVQAIFWSMSLWCDNILQDYHLHFIKKPCLFRQLMTMALAIGTNNSAECREIKYCGGVKVSKLDSLGKISARKVRIYAESSTVAAFRLAADTIDLGFRTETTHPLALLATELRLIVERELTVFCPVLCHWYPEAGMLAALLLHQLFGERLKPFLEGISCLSEDARLVLSAAYMLEQNLNQLYSSAPEENGFHSPFRQNFDYYKIGEISRPLILDWVIAQHARILEWTTRAFDLEDWKPLSSQQKQAASAVEVFRIIEETVDQFFGLNLPMVITHLQALLSIIFHTLDGYLLKLVSQLVEKHHLYPSAPSLTRYKETVFPITKKKVVECVLLEAEVNSKVNELTISKLCIRLNTLQYIQNQIGTLEDGIRKSWASVRMSEDSRCSEELPEASESVDELFVATFDCIRDTAANIIRKLCDFTGARAVFWDLRDMFLLRLYRGSVGGSRLDSIIPHFDRVLNNICGVIDDTLRDLVVSNICKASLEGYVWVLLDGGPSCAFSDSDIAMMEDDLNMLKDFFVADGEGLPRSLVEVEAKLAHQILSLFSLQTEYVIQMLMAASEHISTKLDSQHKYGDRYLGDAHTLIRVLCHKKDREASKFLERHYQLPASSDYDDNALNSSSTKPADLLRSASSRWTERGHSSFRSIKKKLQEATSEHKHAGL